MSSTKWVELDAKPLICVLVVGTIARLEVIAPSPAFKVETNGRTEPWGQSVRNPKLAGGTTVAFITYACEIGGEEQPELPT